MPFPGRALGPREACPWDFLSSLLMPGLPVAHIHSGFSSGPQQAFSWDYQPLELAPTTAPACEAYLLDFLQTMPTSAIGPGSGTTCPQHFYQLQLQLQLQLACQVGLAPKSMCNPCQVQLQLQLAKDTLYTQSTKGKLLHKATLRLGVVAISPNSWKQSPRDSQIEEIEKCSKQKNEMKLQKMKISNVPDKEFKALVIKMFNKHGKHGSVTGH